MTEFTKYIFFSHTAIEHNVIYLIITTTKTILLHKLYLALELIMTFHYYYVIKWWFFIFDWLEVWEQF